MASLSSSRLEDALLDADSKSSTMIVEDSLMDHLVSRSIFYVLGCDRQLHGTGSKFDEERIGCGRGKFR